MNKKLYNFSIKYKIFGYEKHMFNRYKKIEVCDYEDGYMVSSSPEELKEKLFNLHKQKIIKEIADSGNYTTIDYDNCCFNRVYICEFTNMSITDFSCNEATMKNAMKYLSVSEFLDIYGNNIYKKILEGEYER